MVALGPRVGGAHVDVNMKFDDKSLDAVGKRIHRQLASIGEHNRNVYQSIGRESVAAWRAALGATVASAPLMGSAISGLAGAATLLGGAMYSVGQSSGALLPVVTSLGIAGLTASIGMRNFGAAVSETDPKKLQELLRDMPKSMQAAIMSTRAMSKEMRAVIWEKMFVGVGPLMARLRETGVIQRGLGKMAEQINVVARSVLRYITSAEGVSVLNKFFANNARVFGALGEAVTPFLNGFLRLVNALTPSALRFADGLTDVGKRFESWTKGEGFAKRIDESMKRAQKTAGLFFDVLGNLGSAFRNIFGITNPATNTFLEMLVAVTQRFEDFTNSAGGKNSIATWAMQSVDVMRQFGKTIEAVFKVVAELADPRVIISFLKTVEGAFNYLGKLPLDKLVDGFVRIAEAIQPLSSLFLAVIIGGAAFNILLGSLMGQLGGVFAVLGRFKGFGDIFKGIGGSAGKHSKDVSKFTGLLRGIGTVLGKALKFAGIAGLAVYITTLILESEKLKGKVVEVFEAFKGLWEPLKTAFSEIKTSLTPVGKGLKPVFGFLDKIASIGIGLILDTIVYAFESLGKAIEGAGKIISGVIDFFVGLFTLDGSKMLDGLKKMASGVVPLLQGLFGLFATFFAPARLFKLAGTAFKGLGSGIASAVPGILSFLGRFVVSILKFFVGLAPRLLRLGGQALLSLGKAVVKGTPGVLSRIGKLITGVIGWVARLPGRLLSLGVQALSKLGGAVASGTPKVLSLAGRIFDGVVKWIAKLPGRLLELGKSALTKLVTSFRNGVTRVTTAAGTIFKAIWDEIKGLPGDLLDLGKAMIGGLIDGIGEKLGDLKDKVGSIGGLIKGVLPGSPVKYGPLTAWNHGSGATGGGRNVVDAITGGLKNTDPIRRAMADVADAVSGSFSPRVGSGTVGSRTGTSAPPALEGAPGGNIYIGKMEPHNYGEFERQMREQKRLAALGGRRPVSA